jgi:hypothetical protein
MAHVTFIHGIANKPPGPKLLDLWIAALKAGSEPLDLKAHNITSDLVYWADVLYPEPLEESVESTLGLEGATASIGPAPPTPLPSGRHEAAWLSAMAQRLGVDEQGALLREDGALPAGTMAEELERIPLPDVVKEAFLKRFLRDVHHYLFNVTFSPRPGETYRVQDEIRQRFVAGIKQGAASPGPHVVVSHSMGTVIAYDCLKRVPDCPKVDALVTIGSPLGIDEVQDRLLPEWTREGGFPSERVGGKWLNFFDAFDPVARLDPYLSSDYRKDGVQVVEDLRVVNSGNLHHDIIDYFHSAGISARVGQLFG